MRIQKITLLATILPLLLFAAACDKKNENEELSGKQIEQPNDSERIEKNPVQELQQDTVELEGVGAATGAGEGQPFDEEQGILEEEPLGEDGSSGGTGTMDSVPPEQEQQLSEPPTARSTYQPAESNYRPDEQEAAPPVEQNGKP